jgi:hypothetical protein
MICDSLCSPWNVDLQHFLLLHGFVAFALLTFVLGTEKLALAIAGRTGHGGWRQELSHSRQDLLESCSPNQSRVFMKRSHLCLKPCPSHVEHFLAVALSLPPLP